MNTIQRLFLVLILFIYPITSNADTSNIAATLDTAEGEVQVMRNGASEFSPASIGTILNENDVIKTGRHGRAGIVFQDGFLLRLAENTTLQIQPRTQADSGRPLRIDQGQGYFFSREPKNYPVIASPAVTTAIRGTEFNIKVTPAETTVSVLDGRVECKNAHGSAQLGSGEQAYTKLGSAPVKSILLNPRNAVQWTIQFPKLLRKHDVNKTKQHGADQIYNAIYSAQNYLSTGQVEEARKMLIDANQKKLPSDLHALACSMQALIALSDDDLPRANSLVEQARNIEKNNYSALLASAYVAQSQFDLDSSRKFLTELSLAYPDDSFVLAKLAEIEMSFGNFHEAEVLLSKASTLPDNSGYVDNTQGFLYLIRGEIDKAEAKFDSVLQTNTNIPLAHLGRGLALIRHNELERGREAIAKAVYLDPLVALYRSYLGKAYFEEERENLAEHEYERAISLDSKDPTPYLYRAYSRLSQNSPVEALEDVEKSIELNQNRAVYRSRLLLDQDLGVRSAGLAEVFNTLGFSQAARVEAIKSISKDYTNFSAHRMLADSYSTIYLNDARRSERRIAELLSPLSFNLFHRPSADASLNEYSTLFERNQNRFEISNTLSTADDQISPSASVAGKTDQWGYFLSHSSSFTGGSQSRNFSRLYNQEAKIQFQPTYEDKFLLTSGLLFRDREDDNLSPESSEFDDFSSSLSYSHRFGPQSKLIADASFTNSHSDFLTKEAERTISIAEFYPDGSISGFDDIILDELTKEKVKAFRGTVQYLFDSEYVSNVLGTQYYTSRPDRSESSLILDDSSEIFSDLDFKLESSGESILNTYDFYNYTTIHATSWVDLIVGANFAQLEKEAHEVTPFSNETQSRDKLSPKFGAIFYPTDSTTIRASYFETIRKSSLEDNGSLEPSIVAGINQRFTDFSGAEARNVGIGIDQKFDTSTYFGVEGIHRHILDRDTDAISNLNFFFDPPSVNQFTTLGDNSEIHSENQIARTYLYQVLSSRWVAGVDYEYNNFERYSFEQEIDYQRSTFDVRYFDPSGLFALASTSWREQQRTGAFFGPDGTSNFWTCDIGLGYRIPKRHGIVLLKINNIFDNDFIYDQSFGFEEYVRPEISTSLLVSWNF
jgi:Flp pilus assembly protein TadD